MKKLLLLLLTLLAMAPPQAQGRIRVDRLYGLNSDCTGASRYDYDGVLNATKNLNDYVYTVNPTKQKKDQPLISSSNFVNISEIRFRPTQAFTSLNGIEMTDDEAALFGTDAKPIIISVNTNYRLNYDNYYASYAEKTSGTRGLTVNSSNGLFLQQNVFITFKTSDPKYRIHQIFFDAEGFTNTSTASNKYYSNIKTLFKPYGTSATDGKWLTNADADGIHPDPNKSGAKLTDNQRLYSVTDPEGAESVEFWTDRVVNLGTSNPHCAYFSNIIVVWDDGIAPPPSEPAAPVLAMDRYKNEVYEPGGSYEFLSIDAYRPYAFLMSGDGDDEGTEFRYVWNSTEDITIDNYDSKTTKYDPSGINANGLPVQNGTLRVFAVRGGMISPETQVAFRELPVTPFTSLNSLMKPENDGKLVTLDMKIRTRGFMKDANPTLGNAFYDMFVYDGDKAVKVHYFASNYTPTTPDNPFDIYDKATTKPIHSDEYCTWSQDYVLLGTTNRTSPHRYYALEKTIVGIYHHNSGSAPEIEISSNAANSYNYSDFTGPVTYLFHAYGDGTSVTNPGKGIPATKAVQSVNYLSAADFNHQRILPSALYRNKMLELTTPEGEIQRVMIESTYKAGADALKDVSLVDGERYYVEGFIGTYGVNYAIYPIAIAKCPVAPILLAPNKIDTEEVNMISPSFRISINPAGVDESTVYKYTLSGVKANVADKGELTYAEATDPEKGILISSDYFTATSCELTVTAVLGSVESAPVTVRITRHNATAYTTIADFKGIYLGKEDDLPEIGDGFIADPDRYGQMTGKAVIVKKTEEYLYLRDLEVSAGATEFTSQNYILVHNSNKWHNPTVTVNGTERELQEGDVITGFAIVPAVTSQKNLVSETTGFARTVRFTGTTMDVATLQPTEVIVNNIDATSPDYFANASKKLGDDDRMRYYNLKTVQVLRRLNPDAPEDADNPNAKWTYKLKLGSDTEAEWPELTLNVFIVRNGWAAAWGDDQTTDGLVYPFEISGVAMRNGSANHFALAMTDFKGTEAPAAPSVALEGGTDNGGTSAVQYVYTGKIELKGASDDDQIWYTTDGSDALQNPARKLFKGDYEGENSDLALVGAREQVIVSAFAIRPGSSPSAATVRVFERLATEREFIANILKGNDGQWYHFNGDVRVVAVGANYMMVRGVLGQYLPMYSADGWDNLKTGDYLTDFIVRHTLSNGNIQVNATEESTFTASAKPDDISEIAIDQPEAVTSLSTANLRRLVTLRHAEVTGTDGNWSIKGLDDLAQTRNLAVGALGTMTGDALKDGGLYDITGFVMYGTDRKLELWPLSAREITVSTGVTATFSAGTETSGSDNELTARFYPMTEITLSCAAEDAQIYYTISTEDIADDSKIVWSPYVRPIIMVDNGRIHARTIEPGKEYSAHLHINAVRSQMSGDVEFTVIPKDGKMSVALSAKGEVDPATEIHYAVGSYAEADFKTYTGEFAVEQTAIVYARIKEPGKIAGAVSHVLVTVPEDATPSDKISGKVNITAELNDEGKPVVTIAPADETLAPGSYKIYYTLEEGIVLTPENGIEYTGKFTMDKSGLVTAILVENGKPAGEPSYLNVWAGITGIDGIEGTDASSSVRVDGNDIIAPEGSEVYDLSGRRVNPNGLAGGIYIVRTPDGKAVKVRI
ncbi:MAG: hypothetical protein K2I18_05500 [Paramuribaculum sp.]|nr:hypothetical protein [Paramuribaculum sp.]